MKPWETLFIVALVSAAVSSAVRGEQPGTTGYRYPVLRIPKLAGPPKIDGRIEAGEWNHAAAITGVGTYSIQSVVPEIQQVVWYLGFDDKFLYLAMHSPHQVGTYPAARCKENDQMAVLFEDHVEVQICKHDRAKATYPGYGFYKMMVNPRGAMQDEWYWNGTPGSETLWSTGGETRCTVEPGHWDLEMSVAIDRMEVKSLDNQTWVMQLVRTDSCAGIYFAGWVPATWCEWGRFADVTFDPSGPAFQLLRTGEIMAGDVETLVEAQGTAVGPQQIDVTVRMESPDGKELYKEQKSATVKKGERQQLGWSKKGLQVAEKGNVYELQAVCRESGKAQTLYHVRIPVNRLDENYRAKHLEPWLKGRPVSGEWEYRFAYLAYSSVATASVDLDFFGVPKDIQDAASFAVEVRRTDEQAVLAKADAPIAELRGSLFLKLPELADGQYVARFALKGVGGAEISEKTVEFVRKRYPWERNQIGLSDEVIHPYEPLGVNGNTISCWNRSYVVGASGLPAQITGGVSSGSLGSSVELLRAPVRLEAISNGQPLKSEPGNVQFVNQAMHRVELTGSQKLGPLSVNVQAFEEYDGWYQVKMTLQPEAKTTLDSLDLVADLWAGADTLYVQRGGDGRAGNYLGALPDGKGVVWESKNLPSYAKRWGTFVPITFIGNGDRGLWFSAWSDTGWEKKPDVSCVRIERTPDGLPSLRVRFLAGPVQVDGPREVEFALLAAPTKPLPDTYRNWKMAHDTRGYRLWGDSVDAYALHREEDFEALRKFVLYGPRYQADKRYGWWVGHYVHQLSQGQPLAMYGSTWMTGLGMEEFDTFGGEWLGRSNWTPGPDTHYTGDWNYAGTVQWKTPRELSPTGANFCQSQIDCFVWYHKLLAEKCGFNGTWWDNSSIGLVWDYDPKLGRIDEKWNLIYRRQLTKRLAVMGWSVMRPPCWIQNMHVDFSWTQVAWFVENDWYLDAPDQDMFQHLPVHQFRSMARTKSMQLVPYPWFRRPDASTPENERRVSRSIEGMCLSHDIPAFSGKLKREFEYRLGYYDPGQCKFLGYWASRGVITTPQPEVYASAYVNLQRPSAALVFLNGGKADVYLAGMTFDPTLLVAARRPVTFRRFLDLETGEPVNVVFEDGRYKLVDPFVVPWHEYRVLGVE